MAAGKTTADSIRSVFNNSAVVPYFFSSLDEKEIAEHARAETNRNRTVLVVGQYFDYKGLDVAVEVARKCSSIKYKFVGMGNRTDLFVTQQRINELSNVEVVPFLQKEDLEKEYRSCGMLLQPSRKECWGLVINEAASFGTPIVSTYGSGAAVEFLSDGFEQFLAEPNNPDDLYEKVQMLLTTENCEKYSAYLKHKSQLYSIDKSIESHCAILDI